MQIHQLKAFYDDDILFLFSGDEKRKGLVYFCGQSSDKDHDLSNKSSNPNNLNNSTFKRTAKDTMNCLYFLLFTAVLEQVDEESELLVKEKGNIFLQTFVDLPIANFQEMRFTQHLREFKDKSRSGSREYACAFLAIIIEHRLEQKTNENGEVIVPMAIEDLLPDHDTKQG